MSKRMNTVLCGMVVAVMVLMLEFVFFKGIGVL